MGKLSWRAKRTGAIEAESLRADFKAVFADELDRIQRWRQNRKVPPDGVIVDRDHPVSSADAMDLVGVAFSGGGIRSATFNLGVLQALAKLKILRHVDYLSTVSGGGYIGSWLNAMIQRSAGGIADVEAGLNPENQKTNSLPQKAIAYLRSYSNYLTPKVGLLSADTWSLAAIWFRNTLLNLTILVAGVAALILAARLAGKGLDAAGTAFDAIRKTDPAAHPSWWIFAGTAVFLLIAAVFLGLNIGERLRSRHRNDKWVQLLVVCPGLIASLFLTVLIRDRQIQEVVLTGLGLSILFVIFEELSRFRQCFTAQHYDNPLAPLFAVVLQIVVALTSGYGAAWMFYGISELMDSALGKDSTPWLLVTVTPPLILAVLSLAVILNIGLMGRDIPDEVREWAGRLGAWVSIYGLGWLLFFAAAIYGPGALQSAWSWARYTISGAWILATLGSLFGGKSSKTDGSPVGKSGISPALDVAIRIGPYIFMAGFVVLIALGLHALTSTCPPRQATPPRPTSATFVQITAPTSKVSVTVDPQAPGAQTSVWDQYWSEMQCEQVLSMTGSDWYRGLFDLWLAGIAVTLLMSWRIDINEFSLHHFYKNRLVRCYLGASREQSQRRPNPFTKFDPKDDLALNDLAHDDFSGPLPIVNATLNLSDGRNLAWQERKGASFIFTPLYSGYDTGRSNSGTSVSRRMRLGADAPHAGYFPTRYVSKTETGGIHLGTAVAISGAAANPNQGFHTSTAVAFLMTVFDVRLGWWLGNPTRRHATWSSPAFGLPYTVAELFGTTNTKSEFVNLSDGGHFDNMGLYELVRRRCRYIIVCDAEQDETLSFGGIASAIRMCRTDFGVEITIDLSTLERTPDNRPESFSARNFAVGEIDYGPGVVGKLIYLKSSLTGKEPADVLGYHKRVAQFPHESTADQWFSESQFESYRRLGQFIGETAFGTLPPIDAGKRQFFSALQ